MIHHASKYVILVILTDKNGYYKTRKMTQKNIIISLKSTIITHDICWTFMEHLRSKRLKKGTKYDSKWDKKRSKMTKNTSKNNETQKKKQRQQIIFIILFSTFNNKYSLSTLISRLFQLLPTFCYIKKSQSVSTTFESTTSPNL